MRTNNFFKANRLVFISSISGCTAIAAPQPSHAQPDRVTATAQLQLIDADDDLRAKRDIAEVVDDAYVYYLTQVKGFDPHSYSIPQVKQEAAAHAAKIEALLKANPQLRSQKIGTLTRNEAVQMTVGELMDNLNRAEQIIKGDKVATQARNMSYFVQGDVDDWKNRTARLAAKDGFFCWRSMNIHSCLTARRAKNTSWRAIQKAMAASRYRLQLSRLCAIRSAHCWRK